jgi:creatinine amidohydrolase/Fe(II)-dependent formamide hydrolase-like protein
MRFLRGGLPKFLLCLAALFLGLPALADQAVRLEDLTWTELQARIASGATTVLVPIGGTEQNGPHMVLGKHNVRARVLAEEIARRLGNAVVAPVVSYVPEGAVNPPQAHMRYAGTISIPDSAFEALLEGAARSFRQHGFRYVVFLGDHGGYSKSMERAAAHLNREWSSSQARAHALADYYRVTETTYPAQLKQRGYSAAEIGTHAGLADTSLALAVDKSLVRVDRLSRTAPDKDGVHGDPRRANADLGQLGVHEIVETSVAEIQRLTRR